MMKEINKKVVDSALLHRLDVAKGKERKLIEAQIIQLGENVVDEILSSIEETKNNLYRARKGEKNFAALRRRIKVLGKIRCSRAIEILVDLFLRTVYRVNELTENIKEIYSTGSEKFAHDILCLSIDERVIERWIRAVTFSAIVRIGKPALPYIDNCIANSNLLGQKSLKKIKSRIEKKWWQLWK